MNTRALMLATIFFMLFVAAGLTMFFKPDALEGINVSGNPVGNVLSIINKDSGTVTFRIDATFDVPQNIDFDFSSSIDSLYVEYEGAESRFVVDGLSLKSPEEGHIEFVDYTGDVLLSEDVSISGTSKKVRTTDNTLSKESKIRVSGTSSDYTKVLLSSVDSKDFMLNNVSGTMELFLEDGSAKVPLMNRGIKIEDFTGEIQYYQDSIVLNGQGRLNMGVFRAPGL